MEGMIDHAVVLGKECPLIPLKGSDAHTMKNA
jgi:hypothetical protein